jgi:hypothetical protein
MWQIWSPTSLSWKITSGILANSDDSWTFSSYQYVHLPSSEVLDAMWNTGASLQIFHGFTVSHSPSHLLELLSFQAHSLIVSLLSLGQGPLKLNQKNPLFDCSTERDQRFPGFKEPNFFPLPLEKLGETEQVSPLSSLSTRILPFSS